MKLFIEKVTLDSNGKFVCSTVIEATEKQITEFRSKPCDHRYTVDKLIWNEPGVTWDFRYCGVCKKVLGLI